MANRDSDVVVRNLPAFLGPSYYQPSIMCKSDQAPEIISACKQLGFVHEASLERRFPHNSVLERDLRTLEEIARSSHLSAGFEIVPNLWTHSGTYAATVLNAFQVASGKDATRHMLAVGHEFEGRKLLLGQLVHYRVSPAERGKFDASSKPGLFAGFRYDAGPKSFKNVFFVLDYQRLKDRAPGYEIATAVPTEEVWVDGNAVLPLRAAADRALTTFSEAKLESIAPLDIPFASIDGTTPAAKRNEYITLERIIKYGASPGCRACLCDGGTHSAACRARFNALVRADKVGKPPRTPPGTPVPAELPAPSTPAPSALGPNPDDGIPATSGPGGSEDAEPGLVARMRDVIDEEFAEKDRATNRSRRIKGVQPVLFEYACSPELKLKQSSSRNRRKGH